MADTAQLDLTSLTVDLLSAYVASNTVEGSALADLIRSTHGALKDLDSPATDPVVTNAPAAAVGIRKSLASPDHILSMIDGKPYKTLKRHLSSHGLTPETYRERFNLPRDYPMVSKGYSETRRAVATRFGLGRSVKAAPTPVVPTPAAPKPAAAKRAPLKLRLSGGKAKAEA